MSKFCTVEEFKRAMTAKWPKLSRRFINKDIDQWRRLELVIAPHGEYAEHLVWNFVQLFG